jgi:hypothetical protein
MARDIHQRFWEKVEKRSPSECWTWTSSIQRSGHGTFFVGVGSEHLFPRAKRGNREMAHRVSWVLTHGAIPNGMLVLHTCDNPLCVNPEHLYLGTYLENSHDAWSRGRMERQRHSVMIRNGVLSKKLTVEEIREIRVATEPQRIIAHRYGISRQFVSDIQRRRRRGYVL